MHQGPQPGEFWTNLMGRTIEIVARDECGGIEVVGYHFVGGCMVHLRAVSDTVDWKHKSFRGVEGE